jgi:hypothetical protein
LIQVLVLGQGSLPRKAQELRRLALVLVPLPRKAQELRRLALVLVPLPKKTQELRRLALVLVHVLAQPLAQQRLLEQLDWV